MHAPLGEWRGGLNPGKMASVCGVGEGLSTKTMESDLLAFSLKPSLHTT